MDGQTLEHALVDIVRRYEPVVAVYLFGSALERPHRHSDLDVALLLRDDQDADARLDLRLELMEVLTGRLGRPADVVVLNDAPPILRFQVLRNGRLLWTRDDRARCLFEMHSYNLYYDFKPYHDYQVSCLIERIRKEGLGAGYGGARDALAEARQLSQRLAAITKDTS
ncbi:MAG: type VII toxin-antitoxin system MntA family adenylyltransferase antitoxin [Chloroflexia bacterium]